MFILFLRNICVALRGTVRSRSMVCRDRLWFLSEQIATLCSRWLHASGPSGRTLFSTDTHHRRFCTHHKTVFVMEALQYILTSTYALFVGWSPLRGTKIPIFCRTEKATNPDSLILEILLSPSQCYPSIYLWKIFLSPIIELKHFTDFFNVFKFFLAQKMCQEVLPHLVPVGCLSHLFPNSLSIFTN